MTTLTHLFDTSKLSHPYTLEDHLIQQGLPVPVDQPVLRATHNATFFSGVPQGTIVALVAYAWGPYGFTSAPGRFGSSGPHVYAVRPQGGQPAEPKVLDVEPFLDVSVVGTAHPSTTRRHVNRIKAEHHADYRASLRSGSHNWWYAVQRGWTETVEVDVPHTEYNSGQKENELTGIPTGGKVVPYVDFHVRPIGSTAPDIHVTYSYSVPKVGTLQLPEPDAGHPVARATVDFFGLPFEWEETLASSYENNPKYCDEYRWDRVVDLLKRFTVLPHPHELWRRMLSKPKGREGGDKGVRAIENRKDVAANLDRLRQEEPLLHLFFQWLHDGQTQGGLNPNVLLAAFLKHSGSDYDALKQGLQAALDGAPTAKGGSYRAPWSAACLSLPGADKRVQAAKEAKEKSALQTNRTKASELGIDAERYPTLSDAIAQGGIPVGIFHKAGNENAPINVEFDLWEKALQQPGWRPILEAIATDAARRTTYERNVTHYLSFLFKLPQYLQEHTGTPWRAVPKFVESQWELEMAESEGGTTKRRSALTPVADNEVGPDGLCTVTVPYASMAVRGARTTYCYSLDYQVFEAFEVDRESNMPIGTDSLARRLNGRDDYGLMYYTLTGTSRNTGYPTFLIIFERLASKDQTRVHFHRVHPNRIKDGRVVPPCRLIEECYRYMAGNVRAETITAQQGDLIFIRSDRTLADLVASKSGTPVEPQSIREFESHRFVSLSKKPILLIPSANKSEKTRLGFLVSAGAFKVKHPEHEEVKKLPAGTWEVRRCRSWEANPVAVWSLTID